ncbi:MAG TPA: hypothetical protein VGM11_08280 [Acidobacteriaceae bacterium]
MVLGMSLHAFTVLHVIISIAELFAGVVVGLELLAGRRSALTGFFLLMAALTSITGFLFPFHGMTPGIVLGIVSLPFLLLAAVGLYGAHLRGAWRTVYVVSVLILLYLDAFVAVVQSFEKIGPLHVLAPTGKEAPFAVAQGVVLLVFLVIGFFAVKRFHPTVMVAAD